MTGLEKITEHILAHAREEARLTLQHAEERCTALATEYAERTKAERARIAEEYTAKGEALVADAKAAADGAREAAIAEAKASVLARVKEMAREKLSSNERNKYTELLVALLASALIEQHRTERERIKAGEAVTPINRFEVVMNGSDHDLIGSAVVEGARRLVERRIGADKAARIVLSHERLTISGGLLLRFDDVILDYAMDTLLDEVIAEKKSELEKMLFGA